MIPTGLGLPTGLRPGSTLISGVGVLATLDFKFLGTLDGVTLGLAP